MTTPVNKCVTDEHKTAKTLEEDNGRTQATCGAVVLTFRVIQASHFLFLFATSLTMTLRPGVIIWVIVDKNALLFRRERVLKLKPTAPPTAMRSPGR